MSFCAHNFAQQGFIQLSNFISAPWRHKIAQAVLHLESENCAGVRSIDKKVPCIAAYLSCEEFKQQAARLIPARAQLVRALWFDKTPQTNWHVSWHQDKTVAVSQRFDAPHWQCWTLKDGIHHVQPPLEVLNNMFTLRIHFDDCDAENGCLQVIPGSHLAGLIASEHIPTIIDQQPAFFCLAQKGDALLMRPHLLHASNRSIQPAHRRVLHLEFSSWQLPLGIAWG